MRRLLKSLVFVSLALVFAGCGPGGDKGKNRDRDVPKAAEAPAK